MVVTHYRDHLNPKLKAERGLLDQLRMQPESCENGFSKQIQQVGKRLESEGLRPLQAGTYAALLGPSYETLAEIEMLRRMKADAVGMSTVPELLTARGTGTEAAAISVITNVWNDQPMGGHEEVLEASREASQRLNTLLKHLVNETSS
jgi:purine-nucleoside phosphorylase